MSIFNADAFLNSTIDTPLSTERKLIPAKEHAAFIDSIDVKSGLIAEGANAGKPWARLDVVWNFDNKELRDFLMRSKVVLTQGIMLDLTEEGTFDTREGRNVNLGRLLKALDLNDGGFNPRSLPGRFATVRVGHTVYKDQPRDEIKDVMKA